MMMMMMMMMMCFFAKKQSVVIFQHHILKIRASPVWQKFAEKNLARHSIHEVAMVYEVPWGETLYCSWSKPYGFRWFDQIRSFF